VHLHQRRDPTASVLNGRRIRDASNEQRSAVMAQRDAPTSKAVPEPSSELSQQPRAGERPSSPNAPDEQAMPVRRRRVEESAYYRAERRGFAPGAELDDWYAAEAEEDERDGKAADRTQSEGDGSRSAGA
jgi:hypothetical protein